MIIPAQTINTAAIWARVAGLMIDHDDATMARLKAFDGAGEMIEGLADAAEKFHALGTLYELAHEWLTNEVR